MQLSNLYLSILTGEEVSRIWNMFCKIKSIVFKLRILFFLPLLYLFGNGKKGVKYGNMCPFIIYFFFVKAKSPRKHSEKEFIVAKINSPNHVEITEALIIMN